MYSVHTVMRLTYAGLKWKPTQSVINRANTELNRVPDQVEYSERSWLMETTVVEDTPKLFAILLTTY